MKWQIFVLFHNKLFDEHYLVDPSYDNSKYTFFKCCEKYKMEINPDFGYRTIREEKQRYYYPNLHKKMYMVSAILKHIHDNSLHRPYDAVGFLEYDFLLKSNNKEVPQKITEYIDNLVQTGKVNNQAYVSMSYKHPAKRLYSQGLKLNNRNCFDQIVEDYNKYFKTSHNINKIRNSNEPLTTQQAFLITRPMFERMMGFMNHVIQNKWAERIKYLRLNQAGHRPSTFTERYFATFLKLQGLSVTPLYLEHKGIGAKRSYKYERT